MCVKLKFILIILLFPTIAFFSCCSKDEITQDPEFNSLEEEIDYIVNQYYDVGAAIGVIDKQQEQIIKFYGTKTLNENDPPDGNTIFQIGSSTKTFTSLILAWR